MRIEPVKALITDKVRGKTVDFIGVQGDCLVIAMTDGQAYRLGWRDGSNSLVPGSPSLEGVDLRVLIEPLSISGICGM